MLVWLAEHLVKYYSGFNVFSYLTFRAIVSLLTALRDAPRCGGERFRRRCCRYRIFQR